MVEKVHGRAPTTEIREERKKSNGIVKVKEKRGYALPEIEDAFWPNAGKKKQEEQLQAALLPSLKD